ncbi:MAG: hypothetical protein ACI8UD_000095 [Planctomycetota bacterium]|jgi:uncharacterized protein YaiL (DUF2058 family)
MNMRDQLKKAKLLSDKQAKQLAHNQRIERKEKGREQLEQEEQTRKEDVAGMRAKTAADTRRDQQEIEKQRKLREEQVAVDVLIAAAKKPGPGQVKFYFAARDGSLPWLDLSPREAQEVSAGQLCVVRGGPAGTHVYRLLPADSARRVAQTRPDALVYAPKGVINI